MKDKTRLAVFCVVGVLLTALLVWSAFPVVLAGSVQSIAFALFVAFYVTVFFILVVYINHRDPSGWRAYFALSLVSMPFILIIFIFFDFTLFSVVDIIFSVIVALETYITLWFIQPRLEAKFPKKIQKEIIIRRRQGDESP